MGAGGRGALSFVSSMPQGRSELSPPKLSLVCPEVLSGCHRAGSSERELLEQTQFLPVFPTLYSIGFRSVRFHHSVCFIYKLIIGNVSRSALFHWEDWSHTAQIFFGKQKLLINWCPTYCFHGAVLSRSQPVRVTAVGPIVHRAPSASPPGGRRPSATRMSVSSFLNIRTRELFLKSYKLFQLHNFWQEQEIFRGNNSW